MNEITRHDTSRLAREWLQEHPFEAYHYDVVAKELGIAATRVGAALNRMAKMPELGIQHAAVRGMYIYRPSRAAAEQQQHAEEQQHAVLKQAPAPKPPKPTELYERVGTTSAGAVIVRDDDGNLWKLEEL